MELCTGKSKNLIICVPLLPPAILNPNKKTHFMVKSAAARDYIYLVKMFALNAKHAWQMEHNQEWLPLASAKVSLEFTWPQEQRGPMPDLRNLESAFEPGTNALTARVRGEDKEGNSIVGAGILEDDGPEHIEWQPTTLRRGPEPGVRITIEEIADPDEGLELKPEVKQRLAHSVELPRSSLISAAEMRKRLNR